MKKEIKKVKYNVSSSEFKKRIKSQIKLNMGSLNRLATR